MSQNNEEIVDMIVTTVDGLTISNAQDLQNATNFIKDIREKRQMIERHYEPMVKSAKQAYDIAKEERDKYLKPLKQAEDTVKQIMNDYNNKILQLEKIEKQKKLDELAKAIREGDADTATNMLTQSSVDTVVVKEKVNNMSTRKTVKIKVTDMSKVPLMFEGMPILELSKFGESYLINRYKKDPSIKIDGLEFVEEVTTVIR